MADSQKSLKYMKLVETGKKLFWKYGFKRVTVDEICRESDVSKMTFYRFFENKTELAKTIFRRVAEEGVLRFNEVMDSAMAPSEKLKMIVALKAEGTNDISTEFVKDFFDDNETGLRSFVEEVTKSTWDAAIAAFSRAQENGWVRKNIKPGFLFYVGQQLSAMATDPELLKMYNNQQELILEFTNFFTYGILPDE